MDSKHQQNIENQLNMVNHPEYAMKNQPSYQRDPYANKFENQIVDKGMKPPMYNDRQLDKIQQKIQQTEKELALVNQQIIRQRQNLSQDPLIQNHHAQNMQKNINMGGTSPWANTGFNTSSSNYGNHYTYYRK